MSARYFTAGQMRKKNGPPRQRNPLPEYDVTRDGVVVFHGTIGKLRVFLGLTQKSAKDALRYRLEHGVTDETALKAPVALTRGYLK